MAFEIGDRVKVKPGMAHDGMTADQIGTVQEIGTPALGIKFDGMAEVHKWYVENELVSQAPAANPLIAALNRRVDLDA